MEIINGDVSTNIVYTHLATVSDIFLAFPSS